MKILDKKESPLLNRDEYLISFEFEGSTPKKEFLLKELVKELKCKDDCLKIRKIQQESGMTRVKIKVYVYKSLEDLKKIEKEKKKKVVKEEAPKNEEKPKEEVKETEKPKEEKKE